MSRLEPEGRTRPQPNGVLRRACRPNPVFSEQYRCLVEVLVTARREAGLSQRALARALSRSQSHVCKIEQGERRVDALEFYNIARSCRLEPADLYARVSGRLKALELAGGPQSEISGPSSCCSRRPTT